MFAALLGKVAELAGAPFAQWLQAREARKLRAIELEAARHEAELAAAREGRQLVHSWELASIQNSGWKDEYWTIVLSIPLAACFVPGLSPYIARGFQALAGTPPWYQAAVGASIASAFGLRPLLRHFGRRK